MEVQTSHESILDMLRKQEGFEYLREQDLIRVSEEMVGVIREILGKKELKGIIFHEGEEMYYQFNTNTIHLGLGLIKRMAATWRELLGGETGVVLWDALRDRIMATLRGVSAHEAGHRMIHRDPIKVLNVAPEIWGQLGFSLLTNSVLDTQDNQWVIERFPGLRDDMTAAYQFCFGLGGLLEWESELGKQQLMLGYVPRFEQHSAELIRSWAMRSLDHEKVSKHIDSKVQEVIERHQGLLQQVDSDSAYLPNPDPSELELRAKGRKTMAAVQTIYNEGVKVLVERDKENQMVHQAISLVGLAAEHHPLIQTLKPLIDEELKQLTQTLKSELGQALTSQKERKAQFELEKKPVETTTGMISEKVEKTVMIDPKPKTLNDETVFDILGPAVMVEELSDVLRNWLIELFTKLQQQAAEKQLMQLIKDLLENPEETLKELEDTLGKILRPHTVPTSNPTHKEMEEQHPSQQETPALPAPLIPIISGSGVTPLEREFSRPNRGELEDAEAWIDQNLDMSQIIEEWRESIRFYSQKGRKKTDKPTHELHGPTMVENDIRKKMGQDIEGKMFLEKAPKREKVSCSILWRTQAIDFKEALKLVLFLMRIYEDPEIKRYLHLEVLVSQKVPNLHHQDDSQVPVILSFGQDPIKNRENILQNILALKKAGEGGSALTIVQDATALKTQRERLLHHNPGSSRRFLIDLWDEAAIEEGASDPMQAVHDQIDLSQLQLKGKAFCFVLKSHVEDSSRVGEWYGEEHYMTSNSTADLITKMDKVLKSMVKYNDCHASRVRESVGNQISSS